MVSFSPLHLIWVGVLTKKPEDRGKFLTPPGLTFPICKMQSLMLEWRSQEAKCLVQGMERETHLVIAN